MNMELWHSVEQTDPRYAKGFNNAGFKGTATNPTYLAKRATELFGPCGIGWGIDVMNENYREGAPIQSKDGQVLCKAVIHVVYIRLWYTWNYQPGEVYSYGQTTFVGANKNGVFTDEEAPKKSLTDAMVKAMSRLGFSADVHLGLWDDSKYVQKLWDKVTQHNSDSKPPAEPYWSNDQASKQAIWQQMQINGYGVDALN